MSGGSYNYLCYADIEKMLFQTPFEDLQDMKNRLIDLGYEEIAKDMDQLMIEIAVLKNKAYELEDKIENGLAKVWKAVEWADSHDCRIEDAKIEAENYLNEKSK